MRRLEEATTDELMHAVRAIRVRLNDELGGQWGIGPSSFVDIDRCETIIAAYEAKAGIQMVADRLVMADIKLGRRRGQ